MSASAEKRDSENGIHLLPPPDREQFKRSLQRMLMTIIGIYLLFICCIATTTWLFIRQDESHQMQIQETELSSLARALEEHVAHTFDGADEILRHLGNSYSRLEAGQKDYPQALRQLTTEYLLNHPDIGMLAAHSATGEVIMIARQRMVSRTLFPPKSSLPVWQNNAQSLSLLIRTPVRDVDGRNYIPLERPVYNAQGELIGVLSAMINMRHLADYHQETRLTAQDAIAVLGLNGTPLIQYPLEDAYPNSQADSEPLPPAAIRQQFAGVLQTFPHADGHQHMGVFRWLRSVPLIVVASRPIDIARAGFSQTKNRLVGASVVLSLVLFVLAWLSYFDFQRRELARTVLRRMNTSLEDRVNRRTAELEQSNRELIAFSYSISHDLRAPLRAINGFAHALREDFGHTLNEQGSDFLDRIYKASMRMGELIDELLSLANISRAPLTFRDIDLSAMALEIIEELRISGAEREVVFDVQTGLRAEGDEALIRNALTNLLNNAWKFTRSRRPALINLHGVEDGEFVRFTLSDNGVGFDMSHAKHLFQPFQQLHINQGYGGTGIGLASVLRIIERHGGTIWAESAPDQGAHFIFTLPLRAKVIRRRQNKTRYKAS